MIRQPRTLALLLVIATACSVANPLMMSGQIDSGEMVFERPTVTPNSAATTSTVRPLVMTPLPQKPAMRSQLPGKSNVSQTAGTAPVRNSKFPIPGTDPNRPIPTRQSVQQSVATANALSSPIVHASSTATDSKVTRVSHVDPMQGVTPDGGDPILIQQNKKRVLNAPPLTMSPADRGTPPGVRGALFGLNGETATERLLQMRTAALDLERENEELRQQNVGLLARVKESHEQLNTAVREIQLARKEVTLARTDLERLRNDLQALREKVRIAEKEYSAVLQSMGPLLQQLLESDEISALPPNPAE